MVKTICISGPMLAYQEEPKSSELAHVAMQEWSRVVYAYEKILVLRTGGPSVKINKHSDALDFVTWLLIG